MLQLVLREPKKLIPKIKVARFYSEQVKFFFNDFEQMETLVLVGWIRIRVGCIGRVAFSWSTPKLPVDPTEFGWMRFMAESLIAWLAAATWRVGESFRDVNETELARFLGWAIPLAVAFLIAEEVVERRWCSFRWLMIWCCTNRWWWITTKTLRC